MGQALLDPVFLPNKGIALDRPEQFLPKQVAADQTRNMQYQDERLKGRLGLVKFDNAILSGPVLKTFQFWKLDGSNEVMFFTTKDIYKYDFANVRYDILTRTYTTGTIEIQVATPTIVRGTGTSWSASNVKVGDYFKIGAGEIHTGSTWFQVTAVDYGLQQLTLASAAPTTAAGSAYVARLTFTGGNTDRWSVTQFIDASLGEVVLAVNDINTPVYWTGTGQVANFTGLPTGFTTARYITTFFNRVVFGWTKEGAQNQPIRVRWSAVGNFQSYTASHFNDLELPSFDSWIKGFVILGDYLIVPKETGAYVMRSVDNPDDVFGFEFSSTFIGSIAAESNVPYLNGFFYYGTDDRFHYWNIVRDTEVFPEIIPYLRNLDPNNVQYISGWQVENKDEIRWALPYDATNAVSPMVVFNYRNRSVQIWDYKLLSTQEIMAIGEFLNTQDLYVDDPVWGEYFVDEQDGFWDDRTFLASAPQALYGCKDGIVRKADQNTTDDGNAYTRVFETKRFDHGKPNQRKRICKQEWWFDAESLGAVTVRIRRDDAASFDALTKSISLLAPGKDMAKKQITWDKEYENAKYRLEATNHFALHGFLNWLFLKRKTVA